MASFTYNSFVGQEQVCCTCRCSSKNSDFETKSSDFRVRLFVPL